MWVPALVMCLLSLAGAGSPAVAEFGDEDLPRFPIEAAGDIHFEVDGAVVLSPRGEPEVFLYLGVPEEEVACVPIEGRGGGWMQVAARLTFLDAEGGATLRLSSELEIPCAGSEGDAVFRRRIVRLHAPLQQGATAFELQLEDRNAKRRGLVYQLQSQGKRGDARGRLEAPALQGEVGLSGPIFLWSFEADDTIREGPGGLLIGRAETTRELLDPNPARTYGVFQPVLTFYLEAYGLGQEHLELQLRLLEAEADHALHEATLPLQPAWDRVGLTQRLDISRLPAGVYRVAIVASRVADRRVMGESGGAFKVQWDPDSWRKSRHEREAEASLLLPLVEMEEYRRLDPVQQEAYLESLWVSLDGTLTRDGQTTLREIFNERVAMADVRFAGIKRGSLTDRGRVFVRFGEPEEIHKQLTPNEEDLLYYFLQREIDETNDPEAGIRPQRHPMDVSSYEAWYYLNRGDALLDDWSTRSREGALRFIFVDEMGTGDYRLIYTNLRESMK